MGEKEIRPAEPRGGDVPAEPFPTTEEKSGTGLIDDGWAVDPNGAEAAGNASGTMPTQ